MSLPSQSARTSATGRSVVYRRRRSRRPGPLAVVGGGAAVVVLVIVGFVVFDPFGADAEETPPETTAVRDPLVGDRVDGTAAVIAQGSAGRPSGAMNGRGSDRQGTGRERFAAVDQRRTPPATATMPDESVTIPELVPPPLDEDRGMLDAALDSDETRTVDTAPTTRNRSTGTESPTSQPTRSPGIQPGTLAGTHAGNDRARTNELGSDAVSAHLRAADELMARNDPLAARQALWDAMRMPGLDDARLSVLRARLTELNNDLLFGPVRHAGDPLSKVYTVRSGDALSRIAKRESEGTHWRLIQRVNGLSAPEKIRVGQTLKIIPGTFHAVVDKSDFRLDLYHGEPERPEDWVFIRSIDVGLGEGDSTPTGQFIVKTDGKLANPGWVNPRNPAEKYDRDDPENPIGDFWVGLDGLGDAAAYAGYGLHGTIDPGSIGRERSMGCVRMRSEDIALVFELMSEGRSLVRIGR